MYGFLALSIDDPDLPALDVLTQILVGQGGRLFLELRDKQSLAYSVTAFDSRASIRASSGVYIAGDPRSSARCTTASSASSRRS